MGPRIEGTPLTWEEIQPHIEYIKQHGIVQFINVYNHEKNRFDPELKWGDEIEYTVVKFDHANGKVRVFCKVNDLLGKLRMVAKFNKLVGNKNNGTYHHEATAYMIESTPADPYGGSLDCLSQVESNMAVRRREIQQVLGKDESVMSINFPALGVPDFAYPYMEPDPNSFVGIDSILWPPKAYNLSFPRFPPIVRNLRERRGSKFNINVPIFKDKNTPNPYIEDLSEFGSTEQTSQAKPDHIYMDHVGFASGLCCVQATFQTPSVAEARILYDQFIPFTPLVLALSAATPIYRSKLSDVDCRWSIMEMGMDDRTPTERGNSKCHLDRGRNGTTDCYVQSTSEKYNDIEVQYDEGLYQQLIDGDVDEALAKFIAHLFIRDPVPVFRERIEQDDAHSTEHFDTILSTNWNNMRLKPPPASEPSIGWRVEFRPTEVQLTDFENAAYVCFITLISRIIFAYRYDFLLPISMVIENMKRAQTRDAINTQKFFFRTDLTKVTEKGTEEIQELTIDQIINGTNQGFPGIIPLIRTYLETADATDETLNKLSQYIDLISKRASGEVMTLAKWMRDFVDKHPAYKHDSEVPQETVYDMLQKLNAISIGNDHCEKLLGNNRSKIDVDEYEFLNEKDFESELYDTSAFATSLKFKGENWLKRKSSRPRHLIDVIGL